MTDDDVDQVAVNRAVIHVMSSIAFLTPAEKRLVFIEVDKVFGPDGRLRPTAAEAVDRSVPR